MENHSAINGWTAEEKAAAFDRLAEKYYDRNFGSMKKTDMDVMMFSFFIEHRRKNGESLDDYSFAKVLGIPESAVRNLKVKKELQYPTEGYDWKDAFIQTIPYAKYDDRKALVKVSISDPNVKRGVENYMEHNHLFTEYQLNPKLLQMRADHFVELCAALFAEGYGADGEWSDASAEEIAKRLQNSKASEYLNEKEKPILSLTKDALKDNWKDVVKTLANKGSKFALGELLKLIPFGKTMQPLMDKLIDALLGERKA